MDFTDFYDHNEIDFSNNSLLEKDFFKTFLIMIITFVVLMMYSTNKNDVISDMQKEINEKLEKIDQLEKDVFEKESSSEDLINKIKELEQNNSELTKEIQNLNKSISTKDTLINKLQSRHQRLYEDFGDYLKNKKCTYNLRKRRHIEYSRLDIDTDDTSDSDYLPNSGDEK